MNALIQIASRIFSLDMSRIEAIAQCAPGVKDKTAGSDDDGRNGGGSDDGQSGDESGTTSGGSVDSTRVEATRLAGESQRVHYS